MCCFTDFRIAIFGIALLVICGCSKNQSVNENPVKNPAKPNSAVVEKKTSTKPDSAAKKFAAQNPAVAPVESATNKTIATSLVLAKANDNVTAPKPETEPSKSQTEPAVTGNPVTELAVEITSPIPARAEEPITVERVMRVLDLGDFPRPKNAMSEYRFQNILSYKTSSDLETALISVSDEMLKRGFKAGESIPSRSASITIKLEDRPITIFLMNSRGGTKTHVTMYHHQGVDVSSVPLLPAEGAVDRRVDQTYYQTPIGVREGQSLLREKIGKRNIPIAGMRNSNGTVRTFEHHGLEFVCGVDETDSMEFEDPGQPRSKKTHVYVTCIGNNKMAEIPRPDGFEDRGQAYNSMYGSHRYDTKLTPIEATKEAAKLLEANGWRPAESMREAMADVQRSLIRDGVLMQIQASQFGEGRTHVRYNQSLLSFDLPPGIETRMIRTDSTSPELFFTTSASVEDVAKFYTEHLSAIGWTEYTGYCKTTPNQHRQLFEGYYQEPLFLDIENKGPDSTWVRLGPISIDKVAGIFIRPLEKGQTVEPPAETVGAPVETEFGPLEAEEIATLKERMNEIELPATAEEIVQQAQHQIETALKDVPAEEANEIRKMMQSQLAGLNQATEELGTQFDATQITETLNSSRDASEVESEVEMQPEAEVPAGKIAAEDFPVPDDAKKVTRDVGMITFRTDDIKKNTKFLIDKLKTLDWKPRGEQIIETDLCYMKFQKGTGTINLSMTLDDRNDPPVHVVIHGDGIWFADDDFPDSAFEVEMEAEMEAEGGAEVNDAFDNRFAQRQTQFEGLPLPPAIDSPATSGSRFRTELITSVESDLETIHEFFRKNATDSNWKTKSNNQIDKRNVTMTLDNGLGEMIVELQQYDGEVEIRLAFRDPKLAGEHGFVPPKGNGRLILANISKSETTIVINNKDYKLAPEQGAENPKDGIQVDLKPGEYTYSVKGPGRKEQTDKLKVVAGGSWGVVVLPEQGHMAERMY